MKVLLLTSRLNVGGIAVYTITLANYLLKMGHWVCVASGGGAMERELFQGVKRIRVSLDTKSELSPKLYIAVFKLSRFAREENVQIIHAQTRVAQVAAHFISKLTGVPYVATWHGFYRPHLFRRILPCWGERTIAISPSVRSHLTDVFRRQSGKARLVVNGIDTSRFKNDYSKQERSALRRRYGLKDVATVGIIARIAQEKGHICLMDAFKGLLAELPDAQLVIVGDGKLEAELKERAKGLGLGGAVHFFGEVLDTRPFLAIMDVFARPSVKEGFGLGVVEAMLMGLPIVSTDVGGFNEIMAHSKVGILVPPEAPAPLKEALARILTDSALAAELGGAARRYALENFSAERMAFEVEGVYKEVVS